MRKLKIKKMITLGIKNKWYTIIILLTFVIFIAMLYYLYINKLLYFLAAFLLALVNKK